MKNIIKGFRDFILRGNVIDLAVGIMIGAAFNGLISALVRDLMTPFASAIFKQPNFNNLTFTIRGSQFMYGDFFNNLISFLILAFTIYFFIVVPINRLTSGLKKQPPAEPVTKTCPECLSSIPVKAKRCAYCTASVPVQ